MKKALAELNDWFRAQDIRPRPTVTIQFDAEKTLTAAHDALLDQQVSDQIPPDFSRRLMAGDVVEMCGVGFRFRIAGA